jgi:hypothetical protein
MQFINTESELLICCIRAHFVQEKDNEEEIKSLLKKDINWGYFLSIACLNRVISLAWKSLDTIGSPEIPQAVIDTFKKGYYQNAISNALHLDALKKILALFQENNIPVIPFKGPAIGVLYNNFSLRQHADLDIIIHEKDIFLVCELLTSNDYVPCYNPNNISLEDLLKRYHSYEFVKKDGTVGVDVHWCLADTEEEIKFCMDKLWENSIKKTFFGLQTLMLSPHDLILTTCIHHGMRNGWNELRLIADVALIVNQHKQLNWAEIIQSAKDIGTHKALLVGISLANQLFWIDMPPEMKEEALKSASVKRLESKILRQLFENDKEVDKDLFMQKIIRLQIRDNFYKKLLLLKNKLKPGSMDKEYIPLPACLHLLYYIIRPFRLANKYVNTYLSHRFRNQNE